MSQTHAGPELSGDIIKRNDLAYKEISKAMQGDSPKLFVDALDRITIFLQKEDAYYTDALPHFIRMLEIGVERLRTWMSQPVDGGILLDEPLRSFREFVFVLTKWQHKFSKVGDLEMRMASAFAWIFKECQTNIDDIDPRNFQSPSAPSPTVASHFPNPMQPMQPETMQGFGAPIRVHNPPAAPVPAPIPTLAPVRPVILTSMTTPAVARSLPSTPLSQQPAISAVRRGSKVSGTPYPAIVANIVPASKSSSPVATSFMPRRSVTMPVPVASSQPTSPVALVAPQRSVSGNSFPSKFWSTLAAGGEPSSASSEKPKPTTSFVVTNPNAERSAMSVDDWAYLDAESEDEEIDELMEDDEPATDTAPAPVLRSSPSGESRPFGSLRPVAAQGGETGVSSMTQMLSSTSIVPQATFSNSPNSTQQQPSGPGSATVSSADMGSVVSAFVGAEGSSMSIVGQSAIGSHNAFVTQAADLPTDERHGAAASSDSSPHGMDISDDEGSLRSASMDFSGATDAVVSATQEDTSQTVQDPTSASAAGPSISALLASISATDMATIRQIFTPVILAHHRYKHPDHDPAVIAARITDEDLLTVASFGSKIKAEYESMGLDWTDRVNSVQVPKVEPVVNEPSDEATASTRGPTTGLQVDSDDPFPEVANQTSIQQIDESMDIDPSSSLSRTLGEGKQKASDPSARPASPLRRQRGVSSEDGADQQQTKRRRSALMEVVSNEPASAQPISVAPKPPHPDKLPKFRRNLFTLDTIASTVPKNREVSFELSESEVDSIKRYTKRHEDVDTSFEHLCLLLRCLPKDSPASSEGDDILGDTWPTDFMTVTLAYNEGKSFIPVSPPQYSGINEPVDISFQAQVGLNQFTLTQGFDCPSFRFMFQLCAPAPVELTKWTDRANDRLIRENSWRTIIESQPRKVPSPFANYVT